jgi:hypothetical protein
MPMPSNTKLATYDYAYLRVVPRVEAEEFLNAGVILLCREKRFLAARITFDVQRAIALAPRLDVELVQEHLDLVLRMCAGEGPVGQLGQAEVFHWVVAPHSTVIQASPVHSGLCGDPFAVLERLAAALRNEQTTVHKS